MENFFIEGDFCSDFSDVIRICDLEDDGAVYNLSEDWTINAEEAKSEKIFVLEEDFVVNTIIGEITDKWEERFPQDDDSDGDFLKSTIKKGIDIEKMNSLLPELYYPNGTFFKITKKDLIEHLES